MLSGFSVDKISDKPTNVALSILAATAYIGTVFGYFNSLYHTARQNVGILKFIANSAEKLLDKVTGVIKNHIDGLLKNTANGEEISDEQLNQYIENLKKVIDEVAFPENTLLELLKVIGKDMNNPSFFSRRTIC